MVKRMKVNKTIRNTNEQIITTNTVTSYLKNEDKWLKKEYPEQWNKRMDHQKKKKETLEKLVKWLKNLNQKTISTNKIENRLKKIETDSRKKREISGRIKRSA